MMRSWLLRWFTSAKPSLRGHQGTLAGLADPSKAETFRKCACGMRYYSSRRTACHTCRQKRPRPAKVLSYPGPGRLPR